MNFQEMPAEKYHADPCPSPSLSSSVAKILLAQCPRAAWWAHPKLNHEHREKHSRRLDLGTVAHRILLGKGSDFVEMVDPDGAPYKDYKSKAAGEMRDAARAEGKTPILSDDLKLAWDLVRSCYAQLPEHGCSGAFEDRGRSEVVITWRDPVGPWGRAMLDWVLETPAGLVVYDYKTRDGSCNPDRLGPPFVDLGYDIQGAMQERGLLTLHPELGGRIEFRWVFQELDPPHLISVVTLDPGHFDMARKKVSAAFQLWQRCLESGSWPGYTAGPHRLEYPVWEEKRWTERELRDELIRGEGGDPFLDLAPWNPKGEDDTLDKILETGQ